MLLPSSLPNFLITRGAWCHTIADLKSLIMYKNCQTSGWIPLSVILYKEEINSPALTTEVGNDHHSKKLDYHSLLIKNLECQLLPLLC